MKNKNILSDPKDEILYDDDYLKIIKYEDWSVISERDLVVCIPYLIETNQFIMRHEYIPSFKYADGQEYHITIVCGGIEKGESPKTALTRELEEEAGIVLSENFNIEFMEPLFMTKGHSNKYHPCILTLTESDYHEVIAKGDGSKVEKLSKSAKIDIKYINSINTSDLISAYLIEKFKVYLNI